MADKASVMTFGEREEVAQPSASTKVTVRAKSRVGIEDLVEIDPQVLIVREGRLELRPEGGRHPLFDEILDAAGNELESGSGIRRDTGAGRETARVGQHQSHQRVDVGRQCLEVAKEDTEAGIGLQQQVDHSLVAEIDDEILELQAAADVPAVSCKGCSNGRVDRRRHRSGQRPRESSSDLLRRHADHRNAGGSPRHAFADAAGQFQRRPAHSDMIDELRLRGANFGGERSAARHEVEPVVDGIRVAEGIRRAFQLVGELISLVVTIVPCLLHGPNRRQHGIHRRCAGAQNAFTDRALQLFQNNLQSTRRQALRAGRIMRQRLLGELLAEFE